MRLRVLLLGLTFFVGAVAVAAGPHLASGHSPNLKKPCTIVGTPGDDALLGTPDNDVICAGKGDDVIAGQGGNDIIRGGPGKDTIEGGAGRDVMLGGPGNDRLRGYDGTHDHLNGGKGTDYWRDDRLLDKSKNVEIRL